MTTFSNTMESKFSLVYNGSSDLPFSFKQASLFDWVPFSMMKNPSNRMKGIFEVLPIPTKKIIVDVIKDTYVRSDYEIMNYGTDGSVMAYTDETATVQAYFASDIYSAIKGIPQDDLISAVLSVNCQSYTPPNSTSNIVPMGNDWYENDVNWFHKPEISSIVIGTIIEDSTEAYVNSSDLKSYIQTLTDDQLHNFAIAVLNETPGSFFLCTSKESTKKPQLVFTVVDREAMRQVMYSERPFKIIPRIRAYSDLDASKSLPFSFTLISKNLFGELPFELGIRRDSVTTASKVKVLNEIPFTLTVQKNSLSNLPTNFGVNRNRIAINAEVSETNDIPFDRFVAAHPGAGYLSTSLGINRNRVAINAEVNEINELAFGQFIPRVPRDSTVTFELAPKHDAFTSTIETIAINDVPFGNMVPKITETRDTIALIGARHETQNISVEPFNLSDMPMNLTARQWDNKYIYFNLAAKHDIVNLGGNLANPSDIPLSLTARQWDDSKISFELAPKYDSVNATLEFANLSEIPFGAMNVLAREYLPIDFCVEAKSYIPFNVDNVIPVSNLPFNVNVISPYLQFHMVIRTPDQSYLPINLVPRIRQANDLHFSFTITQGGSYVYIM